MSEITPNNRMRIDLHRMTKLIPILKVQPRIRSWQIKVLDLMQSGQNMVSPLQVSIVYVCIFVNTLLTTYIKSNFYINVIKYKCYTGWQSNMLYTLGIYSVA